MIHKRSREFLFEWMDSLGVPLKSLREIEDGWILYRLLVAADGMNPEIEEESCISPKDRWDKIKHHLMKKELGTPDNFTVPSCESDCEEALQWAYSYWLCCKPRLNGVSNKTNSLENALKILENERDFYFEKLVKIEQLLLEKKAIDLDAKERILDILFKRS